jgi:hypothetical protein
MLNGRSMELIGQRLKNDFSRLPIVAKHSDFDESMRRQGQVSFFDDSSGEAIVANHHNRVKVMG